MKKLSSDFLAERKLRSYLKNQPSLTLRMDITNKCNLRCIMCHFADEQIFKRKKREFTTEEFQMVFEKIAPLVKLVVLSCGCEPLLSRHLEGILGYLATNHPRVEIELCTNAVLMNAEIRTLFIETGITYLMVSLDGVTRNAIERVRIGANYNKVIGNIIALRDLKARCAARFPKLVLNYVMLDSYIHEAPLFVEMARRMGAECVDFHHAVPGYSGFPHHEKMENNPAKFNHYRARIIEEGKRKQITVFIPDPFDSSAKWNPNNDPTAELSDYESVIPDIHFGKIPMPKTFPEGYQARNFQGKIFKHFGKVQCLRPFTEIMIREMDEVLPCPWFGSVLGKLSNDKDLNKTFWGKNFRKLRLQMIKNRKCEYCVECPLILAQLTSRSDSKI
ncbi:radical SAM protein [bacterium]|nr:radical SAM protein [bacterium]